MAVRSTDVDLSGNRRARLICAVAAASMLGLGLWRSGEIFSQPAASPGPFTLEQEQLLHIIEPLTGVGNVRVNVRDIGDNARDFLILVDVSGGVTRSLGEDIEALLKNAAGFDAEFGDKLTVHELPFAKGASAQPSPAEILELTAIGFLMFLLSWGAFAPQPRSIERSVKTKTKRKDPEAPPRTRPVAVDLSEANGPKTNEAAKAATSDPAGTAKIIRAWMHTSEDRK